MTLKHQIGRILLWGPFSIERDSIRTRGDVKVNCLMLSYRGKVVISLTMAEDTMLYGFSITYVAPNSERFVTVKVRGLRTSK